MNPAGYDIQNLSAVSACEVIFLSGYSEYIFSKEGFQDRDTIFFYKPLLPSSLHKKVREVLDGS
jgi:YesN/AraC family two-component response regulator